MAAIDSFEHLWREINSFLTSTQDVLALIGVLYASKKALNLSGFALGQLYDFLHKRIARKWNLSTRFGPWAVVTGSSEGIGKAYAEELAARGVNIIMISRGQKRLEKAAKDIAEKHGVETFPICEDFATDRVLYSRINEAIAGKEIGILVNNVGVMYDYPQMFLDVPETKLWELITVNIAAATIMTHMILPQMVARRRGAIVMVSSGACTQITPQMTIYAATKSYLNYFAKALQYEYEDKGIFVQSLKPFYVATRMTRYSESLSNPSIFIPNASVFARHAITTLGVRSVTSGYFPHSIQSWLANLVPEWLWMWGAFHLNSALRQQALNSLEQRKGMSSIDSEQSINSLSP